METRILIQSTKVILKEILMRNLMLRRLLSYIKVQLIESGPDNIGVDTLLHPGQKMDWLAF